MSMLLKQIANQFCSWTSACFILAHVGPYVRDCLESRHPAYSASKFS